MKHMLTILLAIFIISTPAYSKEVNLSELQTSVDIMHSHAWFKGFFYIGSDDKFHHFIEKWDFKFDPKYEVDKATLELEGELKLGKKEIRFSTHRGTDNPVLFSIGNRDFFQKE